jgi:hypothetical protein
MSLLAVPDLHFRRYQQIAEVLTRHGLRWRSGSSLRSRWEFIWPGAFCDQVGVE